MWTRPYAPKPRQRRETTNSSLKSCVAQVNVNLPSLVWGQSTYSHLSSLLDAERVVGCRDGGLEAKHHTGRDLQGVTVTEQEALTLLVDLVCIPLSPVARQVSCIHEGHDILWVLFVERHGVDVNVSTRHMAVQYLILAGKQVSSTRELGGNEK